MPRPALLAALLLICAGTAFAQTNTCPGQLNIGQVEFGTRHPSTGAPFNEYSVRLTNLSPRPLRVTVVMQQIAGAQVQQPLAQLGAAGSGNAWSHVRIATAPATTNLTPQAIGAALTARCGG